MKTNRDYECAVPEAESRRCGYVWGDHGEHECGSYGHDQCVVSDRLLCHICRWCEADVMVKASVR